MERRGLDLNLRSGGRWGPRVFRLRGNIIHKRQRGSTALRRRDSAELLGGGERGGDFWRACAGFRCRRAAA